MQHAILRYGWRVCSSACYAKPTTEKLLKLKEIKVIKTTVGLQSVQSMCAAPITCKNNSGIILK